MDGDWNEVKAKPKKHRKPKQEDEEQYHYGGGFGAGGMLKAGAVKKEFTIGGPKREVQHSASAVADADYLRDEDEEIKYEKVSHDCAIAVQNARLAKDWSQAELAKKVNEKTSAIVDLENGTAKYNADLINRCERVLGVKIPRNRNKK